jgi:hypothetical protein
VVTTKHCPRCARTQPDDAFVKIVRRGKPALSSWCKECRREQERAWRQNNQEKYREQERRRSERRRQDPEQQAYYAEYKRRYRKTPAGRLEVRAARLRREYGLTVQQFEAMLEVQGGRCLICRNPPRSGAHLHVDHCHNTGKIRGLLCFGCNGGLGAFRDDIGRMRAAIAYLEAASASRDE